MAAAIGNQYAAKEKRWRMAINRALENKSRAMGVQALDAIAEQMISVALGEDETADVKDKLAVWREIADRLDGKPAQVIQGDEDAPLVVREIAIKLVEAAKVLPGDAESQK